MRPAVTVASPTVPATEPSGWMMNSTGVELAAPCQTPRRTPSGWRVGVIRGGWPNISLAQSRRKTASTATREITKERGRRQGARPAGTPALSLAQLAMCTAPTMAGTQKAHMRRWLALMATRKVKPPTVMRPPKPSHFQAITRPRNRAAMPRNWRRSVEVRRERSGGPSPKKKARTRRNSSVPAMRAVQRPATAIRHEAICKACMPQSNEIQVRKYLRDCFGSSVEGLRSPIRSGQLAGGGLGGVFQRVGDLGAGGDQFVIAFPLHAGRATLLENPQFTQRTQRIAQRKNTRDKHVLHRNAAPRGAAVLTQEKLIVAGYPETLRMVRCHGSEPGLGRALLRRPGGAAVARTQKLAGEAHRPAVLKIVETNSRQRPGSGGGFYGLPVLTAIGRAQDGARPAHRPAMIRIQEENVFQRHGCSGLLLGPRGAAIGGVKDGAIEAARPRAVAQREKGENVFGGSGVARLPGLAAIGGGQQNAAFTGDKSVLLVAECNGVQGHRRARIVGRPGVARIGGGVDQSLLTKHKCARNRGRRGVTQVAMLLVGGGGQQRQQQQQKRAGGHQSCNRFTIRHDCSLWRPHRNAVRGLRHPVARVTSRALRMQPGCPMAPWRD